MFSFLRGLFRRRKRGASDSFVPAPPEEVEKDLHERRKRRKISDEAEEKAERAKAPEGHYDRNKKKYIKKRSPLKSLRGKQGILATTATLGPYNEKKALGEFIDLVDDAIDALYPVPETAKSLEEARKVPPRFIAVDLQTAGVLYITFKDTSIDAVKIAVYICEKLVIRARRIARIVPFSDVCYASEEDVLTCIVPLLSDLQGRTFAVDVKRRNNERFPKDDVIKSVASTVPRPWRVDLQYV